MATATKTKGLQKARKKPFPWEVEEQRFSLVARSPFNRQMQRLIVSLRRLREDVGTLSTFNEFDISKLFDRAGLPPIEDDDSVALGLLSTAESMASEADGFLWAIGCFLGALEANVLGRSRRRSERMLSTEVEEVANEPASIDNGSSTDNDGSSDSDQSPAGTVAVAALASEERRAARETAEASAERVVAMAPAERGAMLCNLEAALDRFAPSSEAASSDFLTMLQVCGLEFCRLYYPKATSASFTVYTDVEGSNRTDRPVHLPIPVPAT